MDNYCEICGDVVDSNCRDYDNGYICERCYMEFKQERMNMDREYYESR